MNPVATKQVALDNSLVPSKNRLKIEKCNARIEFRKPQREETYQVTLDALKLYPCYPAFLINAEVPEVYMHQFWNTIQKIKDTDAYRFKLDKKFRVDTKVFCKILQIVPDFSNQTYLNLFKKNWLHLSRNWVILASGLIDSGNHELKSCGVCTTRRNVDYVSLPEEELLCNKADNKEISSNKERAQTLTKISPKLSCINLISIDKTISMRNMINLHTISDDTLLGTLKFVSKTQDYYQYGALIPDDMINQDINDSKAYKTYLDFATRKATPKKARNFKKVASPSRKLSLVLEEEPSVPKKKTPAKVDRGKGMDLLSEVALLEDAQLKQTLKKNKQETRKLHASGSNDGVGSQSKVPNEHQDKRAGTNELTDGGKRVRSNASSSVSSNFANQFLNLDNVPPTDTEVVSMMNVKVLHEEPSSQTPPLLNIPITVISKTLTAVVSTISSTIPPITPL
ncbi:hypothetical protein Tco_1165552 [Tanacetum coccineum]